jgi:hypothetical protein
VSVHVSCIQNTQITGETIAKMFGKVDKFWTYQWVIRNHNSSFSTVDEEENIIQDMPEAALVAAQAYLLTTQAEPVDPHESMHLAVIKNLRLIGDELKKKSLEKGSMA